MLLTSSRMTAVVERVTGFALASQANKASAWRSKNCPTAALVMFGDNLEGKHQDGARSKMAFAPQPGSRCDEAEAGNAMKWTRRS